MNSGAPAAAEQAMSRTIRALDHDLERIRVGGASAALVEDIHVDHLGRRARLIDLASVTIPDPRQIVIRPWEPASLRAIGTAIRQSRIGLTPTIDGPTIRLYVPPITEERRRELVGLVHRRVEQARVEVRNARHDALGVVRAPDRAAAADDVRRDAAALQRITDRAIAEIDRLGRAREERILRL